MLDELFIDSLPAFISRGVIDVDEIIVDGTKVKALGKSSFSRAVRLDQAVPLPNNVFKPELEVHADP